MSRPAGVPSYRLHKQSGQAIVTLPDGVGGRRHDVLLGRHGTAESRAEYARVIAEWEASGRRPVAAGGRGGPADLTVNELLLAYYRHAEGYYVKDHQPTKQLDRVKRALAVVRELYGHTPVRDFGPLALKAIQQAMADKGWCRRTVNQRVSCVKLAFKWGTAEEMVPPEVHYGLQAVAGLKKGRTKARETGPVLPVAPEVVEATLPHLHAKAAGMVRLQLFSGARPGEVCRLRACDLDRSAPVWLYRPHRHKTEHHARGRVVPLGPRAQEVLPPFLRVCCPGCALAGRPGRLAWRGGLCGVCGDRADEAGVCGPWPHVEPPGDYHVFSPSEAMASVRARRSAGRKTPASCGNGPGTNRKRRPRRQPGERYRPEAYAQVVRKACLKAGVEPWAPNRLRHTHGTEVRRLFGLEAAQAVLGHARADVTQVYAERDLTLAVRVAAELG